MAVKLAATEECVKNILKIGMKGFIRQNFKGTFEERGRGEDAV